MEYYWHDWNHFVTCHINNYQVMIHCLIRNISITRTKYNKNSIEKLFSNFRLVKLPSTVHNCLFFVDNLTFGSITVLFSFELICTQLRGTSVNYHITHINEEVKTIQILFFFSENQIKKLKVNYIKKITEEIYKTIQTK